MISPLAYRRCLVVCLVGILVLGLILAVERMQHEPGPARYENNVASALRYVDHMALNSARNSVLRAQSVRGETGEIRFVDSLIAALDSWRETGEGRALERIAEAHPGDTSVQLAMGRLASSRGNPEAARRRFEQVLQAEPDNAAAWLALGDVLDRLGDPGGALHAFGQAHERRGKFDYVAWHYSQALLERGETAAAMPILSALVREHRAKHEYALQYFLAARGQPCDSKMQALLREVSASFQNDLTMSLGDNGETWSVVVNGERTRLQTLEEKRALMAQLETSPGEVACQSGD